MKIAYTTYFDANDVHNWSGTPYYMSHAFVDADTSVEYIGALKHKLPPFFKVKQKFNEIFLNQRVSPRFNTFVAQHYSQQVAKRLENVSADVIVSPLLNPISYLDCKQPIVLWTDALYAGLLGFYTPFSRHTTRTIAEANRMTSECLSRCKLAIFSSDWAANSAIELYGASKDKVKVIPFGANIESHPSLVEIRDIIKKRDSKKIKLLFLAKSWERKGGDVVLKVAEALHQAGHPVELTIVGYNPPNLKPVPAYVKCLGYVSKHDANGANQIQALLAQTHFLFVPSRAEAYGIVFCEANAFGVPCLTTYVGGIGTVVKDHVNGMTFGLDTSIESYCDYIVNLMQNRLRYEELALSSYNEFVSRLNWQVATSTAKKMMKEFF